MQENRQEHKMKWIKFGIILLAIGMIVLLVQKLVPIFSDIGTEEGRLLFKDRIEGLGPQGFFLLLVLQFMQILVAFLPGEPIELLAGMCYGTVGGMILIFLGAFLSAAIIFFAVRKFGKSFIRVFFGKANMEKIEKSEFLKQTEKIEYILLILFLIPGTPKDFLIYLAGLLPIHPMRFLMIATFARFPSVISSTFAGENVTNGNWGMVIITYLVTFGITGIALFVHHKIKGKTMVKAAVTE